MSIPRSRLFGSIISAIALATAGFFLVTFVTGCKEATAASDPAPALTHSEAGERLLEAYLDIHDSLHQDSTEGVSDAGAALAAAARTLIATSEGAMAGVAGRIAEQAGALAGAGDLEAARAAYMPLSESMIQLRAFLPAAGELVVVHCPMKNGSWIQRGTAVLNPYHGSEMLGCGRIVDAGRPQQQEQGGCPHGDHGHHH